MENKEFIEVYEKILDRVGNIKKSSDNIRNKINDVNKTIREGARTIRLVTIDITPSERFVSDNVFLSQKTEKRTERDDDGNPKEVEYTITKHVTTTSKGFGQLKKTTPFSHRNWDPTTTSELDYSEMLGLIADNTKMMLLLKEFLSKNKKKGSQRVMDLIGVQTEAKELKEFGDNFDSSTITIELDTPVAIKNMRLNRYGSGEIIKQDIEINSIKVESNLGITLIGNEDTLTLSETELADYPNFIQIIETLENTFNKMIEKLEQDNTKILEINTKIEEKLSEFIIMDKLDSSRMENTGEVRW
jgi:hypothetical protein